MTHKEMSEIFAVMLLAYPNAEVFKGGIAKLGPTINLWVTCLPEIDFWTGQQAVVKLVRECKFPPTIAEFKEKAEKVQAEVKARIDQEWNYLKLDMVLGKTPEEAVARLPEGTDTRRVIEAMGGPHIILRAVAHGKTADRRMADGKSVNERGERGRIQKRRKPGRRRTIFRISFDFAVDYQR